MYLRFGPHGGDCFKVLLQEASALSRGNGKSTHLVLSLLARLLLVGLELGKLDLHVLVADCQSSFPL